MHIKPLRFLAAAAALSLTLATGALAASTVEVAYTDGPYRHVLGTIQNIEKQSEVNLTEEVVRDFGTHGGVVAMAGPQELYEMKPGVVFVGDPPTIYDVTVENGNATPGSFSDGEEGGFIVYDDPDNDYIYTISINKPGYYLFTWYTESGDDTAFVVHISGDPVATDTVGGFGDVRKTDYFAEPVLWAVENGVTNGTSATAFSPSKQCTTAQILTFLYRANGSPAVTGDNPFTDVPDDSFYRDAAIWAHENGLVSGTSFGGDLPCTRSATVTYLWKLAGAPEAEAVEFMDVEAESAYAQAVSWAVAEGITNGTSATSFSPDNICSRGQIVTFLYRALAE